MTITWNPNAKEFTPSAPKLRLDAPVFVPLGQQHLADEVKQLIREAGIGGILISDIPKKYFEIHNKHLKNDLTSFVRSLDGVSIIDHRNVISSQHEAMKQAGLNVVVEDLPSSSSPVMLSVELSSESYQHDEELTIGSDGDKFVRDSAFDSYVEELIGFKQSIINVVYNFGQKNELRPLSCSGTGLALSLFAAEWDRYHSVRGIVQQDLKSLRDKFGAVKLMPFLQSIPELDVVGTHPEVRVRIRDGYCLGHSIALSPRTISSRRTTPENSFLASSSQRTNISLNSELFGEQPVGQEMQTRIVLEQMLANTQSQILGILSSVPQDPLAAAAAIEEMNQLQVLVNALKAALAVLPPPLPTKQINIEDALFGGSSKISKKPTLELDSLLGLGPVNSPPVSPLSSAANAGNNVGSLLADLSRILFAQVIQQQQSVPEPTIAETNAALERTLAEIVSAASTPACTPPVSPIGDSDISLVSGQLIIPNSLPNSPIPILTSAEATPMDQLLRGLMTSVPPPGLSNNHDSTAASSPVVPTTKRFATNSSPMVTNIEKKSYGKDFMLSILSRMSQACSSPPKELEGLECKQLFRAPRKLTTAE